jgi:hypothetical protein
VPAPPAPPEAADDATIDDKTVLYTTGPALVTRAFFEGGFASEVTLLYASPLGADDARGWGQLGEIGSHMHAGTRRYAEICGDMGRYAEICGDIGRHACGSHMHVGTRKGVPYP